MNPLTSDRVKKLNFSMRRVAFEEYTLNRLFVMAINPEGKFCGFAKSGSVTLPSTIYRRRYSRYNETTKGFEYSYENIKIITKRQVRAATMQQIMQLRNKFAYLKRRYGFVPYGLLCREGTNNGEL